MRNLIGVVLLVLSFENLNASSLLRYISSKDNDADTLVGDHTEIICDAVAFVEEEYDEFDYENKLSHLIPLYGKSEDLEKIEASNNVIMKDLYAHIVEEFMNQDANPIGQFISLHAVLEMMELALINADRAQTFFQAFDSKPTVREKKKWREVLLGKKKTKETKRSEKKEIEGKARASEDERVFVLKWYKNLENYRDFLDGKDQGLEPLRKVSLTHIDLFIQCLEVAFSASLISSETPYLVQAQKLAREAAKEYLRDYRNDTTSWAILWNSVVDGKLLPLEIERAAVRSKVTFLSFMFENKYILDMLTGVNHEISQLDRFFKARAAKKILDNLRKVQNVEGAEDYKILFDIITTKLEVYWKNNSINIAPIPEVRLLKDDQNDEGLEDGNLKSL